MVTKLNARNQQGACCFGRAGKAHHRDIEIAGGTPQDFELHSIGNEEMGGSGTGCQDYAE